MKTEPGVLACFEDSGAQVREIVGRNRGIRFLDDCFLLVVTSNLKCFGDSQTAMCSRLIIFLTITRR